MPQAPRRDQSGRPRGQPPRPPPGPDRRGGLPRPPPGPGRGGPHGLRHHPGGRRFPVRGRPGADVPKGVPLHPPGPSSGGFGGAGGPAAPRPDPEQELRGPADAHRRAGGEAGELVRRRFRLM